MVHLLNATYFDIHIHALNIVDAISKSVKTQFWAYLFDLYEAWNKPDKAKEWRVKLAQIEDFEE